MLDLFVEQEFISSIDSYGDATVSVFEDHKAGWQEAGVRTRVVFGNMVVKI